MSMDWLTSQIASVGNGIKSKINQLGQLREQLRSFREVRSNGKTAKKMILEIKNGVISYNEKAMNKPSIRATNFKNYYIKKVSSIIDGPNLAQAIQILDSEGGRIDNRIIEKENEISRKEIEINSATEELESLNNRLDQFNEKGN